MTVTLPRYKQMMKDYWYVLIPVHVATSIAWYFIKVGRRRIIIYYRFGGFYVMLKSGVDIVGFLEMIGTSQKILDYMRSVTVQFTPVMIVIANQELRGWLLCTLLCLLQDCHTH